MAASAKPEEEELVVPVVLSVVDKITLTVTVDFTQPAN